MRYVQNFYEEIGRQELYVVYLHKLCDLHLQFDSYTEAAHTKMLYAKLLDVRYSTKSIVCRMYFYFVIC